MGWKNDKIVPFYLQNDVRLFLETAELSDILQ